jgi:3-oxosteroid 1-dehydrogenase
VNKQNPDLEVDVLVVGSGNGGLTAALCAYEMGLKQVLVIEKTAKYGGTSATSGGGIWVPCSDYSKAAGATDSYEEALQYVQGTTPAGTVPLELQQMYLREGPRMLAFLHERTRVRYESLAHYPDYWSTLPGAKPGHRSLEPAPLLRTELGAEEVRLRDTHHMMWMFDRIAMTQVDAQILMAQMPGWKKRARKLITDHYFDIPWMLTHRRSRRIACGAAGIARLRWSMLDRQMPLMLNTSMTELLSDASGRVIGAVIEQDGVKTVVRARHGVVLAAGGFEHNQAMRDQYLPKPTNVAWSAAHGGNTGDAIQAAIGLGAVTHLMDGGWWCTTLKSPDDPVPRLAIMDKSYPGNIMVTARGVRIANESQNYLTYQLALFDKQRPEDPQVPAWMVFDARSRRSYFNGPLWPTAFRPEWMVPKSYYSSGFLTKADSIQELAAKAGIDPAGLERTVASMNEYAKTGKDLEYGRGDAEYDRYYADPRIQPNPCLAPIVEAPFYAMRMEPGDFGTHGGLVIDVNSQVTRADGSKIAGLYALGNSAAPILPRYPGPGSTLGPAMTFAWQAAKHMSGQST